MSNQLWFSWNSMFYNGEWVELTDSEKAAKNQGYKDYPNHNPSPAYTEREQCAYHDGNTYAEPPMD